MENFDSETWEEGIYGKGQHLNKYPFDNVVSFIFRNYPRTKERKDIRILEVGCGSGNNLWFAARENFSVVGLDGSSTAITFAKERFQNEKLNDEFVVGDFTKLPFSNEVFDLVIDRATLICCSYAAAKKAVHEIHRVLLPNGKFFFNAYSKEHSSYTSGATQPDGMVSRIKHGSLTGVGNICFNNYEDIEHLFDKSWSIEKIAFKEFKEMNTTEHNVHAEWEVVARKLN